MSDYKKEFVIFLKKNNAFGAFVLNFNNSKLWRKENGEIYDEHKYFTNTPCERYISGAFLWNRTPQGQRFWANKHDAWKDFLNKTIQGFNFWDSLHKKWTALLDKMRINNYEFEA